MSVLNWWYAVPLSSSVTGFVLCAVGMYFMPNAIEYDPDERRTRQWGWLVTILVLIGMLLLMAAGPLCWLPVLYG
jgi:multisubunit Na+/H+ antiporter MnhB subunit